MFRVHKTKDGSVPPVEYLPAEAITPKVGMVLEFDTTSHQLQASTTTAQYICQMEAGAVITAGDIIPVIAIDRDTIYETRLDGDTALDLGQTCDIDATSLLADGDGTTNNDLLIVGKEGSSEGDSIYVKFVK
ncbi:MAG: hypothetical protein GX847_09030 [Clostridiales bacterium]|nr:hypothetical protein [Clostridiales bacterium]